MLYSDNTSFIYRKTLSENKFPLSPNVKSQTAGEGNEVPGALGARRLETQGLRHMPKKLAVHWSWR